MSLSNFHISSFYCMFYSLLLFHSFFISLALVSLVLNATILANFMSDLLRNSCYWNRSWKLEHEQNVSFSYIPIIYPANHVYHLVMIAYNNCIQYGGKSINIENTITKRNKSMLLCFCVQKYLFPEQKHMLLNLEYRNFLEWWKLIYIVLSGFHFICRSSSK